ncbi:CapA family protein [Clostridium sp. CCUG 7971]|uniref:CapA family protein n=1 Tax=Clostridium sp. CCUG 7971 TaxID=2811414 RepID=UPI001ABAF2DF|nr:CapA family protein [Clostridium sp. CCUG 7971]MBO3443615.1 CapA family protein [Clostridium sp. CCUG 7971]
MSRSRKNQIKKRKIKILFKKLFFIFFVLLLSSGFLITNLSKDVKSDKFISDNQVKGEVFSNTTKQDTSKITLSAVGDVMSHNPQLKAQFNPDTKSYSFDNNFKYVKKYIENSDLAIANLETTLAGPSTSYTSYPTFNSPDELIDGLKFAGVDILSTINNHSFDKGDLGVKRTLEVSKEKGFDTVGTTKNVGDANYLIKDVNNIKLGITAFSYGEIINNTKKLNGITISNNSKDKMNIFDMHNVDNAFNTISNTLDNLKDTDIQIVIIHWGNEYQRTPSEFQRKLAKKLSDAGVDIIIGSHPHVVQPAQMIKSSNGNNDTLVIYSLGNFISNQRRELLGNPFTEDGLMADIEITKDFNKNKTFVSKVNFIPTWVNKYRTLGKDVYEIIPISDKNELSTIENLPLDKVKASFDNTISQIENINIFNIPKNPFE